MLDEALTSPVTLAPAVTLGYRRYESFSDSSAGFATVIGLAPRTTVDEISAALSAASPQGSFGFDLRTGLGYDAARDTRLWRAGAELTWAPTPAVRLGLGYGGATEVASGLVGRRDAGWLRIHVDL
jgi:hypothetical protein